MQTFNKSSFKKIMYHSWYLYPLSAFLIVLLWLWGFQAFHQPSAHERLQLFFASEIKNESFLNKIVNNYKKEKLREAYVTYGLPESVGFGSKLQIAVNNADMLILDETTLKAFDGHDDNYFKAIPEDIKEDYIDSDSSYYTVDDKSYGILLKNKNEDHWLKEYMTFDEEENYYICLSVTSQNLGRLTNEDNTYYDNALTFINHLLKEN